MGMASGTAGKWPQSQGDPRRADLIKPYRRVPPKEEDQDPDLRAIASLALGMAGLFTKVSLVSAFAKNRSDRPGGIKPREIGAGGRLCTATRS